MGRRLIAGLQILAVLGAAAPVSGVVVTVPAWIQLREMAGFIPSPSQSDVITQALQYGYLLPEEVDDPELEYYQAVLPFYGLDGRLEGRVTAVFQVHQKKGSAGDDRSAIAKVLLLLWAMAKGSGIASCVWHHDDDERRLQCTEWIRTRFGQPAWQAKADGWLVVAGEKLDFRLRQIQAAAGAYRMLVLEKDRHIGDVYTEGQVFPAYVTLHVPAHIIPDKERMVVPLRFVENAGLGIAWDPAEQAATLRRPSDGYWVRYAIGANQAETSDGETLTFDVAPALIGGRTVVGLRATLNPFCGVLWQNKHQRAILTCGQ